VVLHFAAAAAASYASDTPPRAVSDVTQLLISASLYMHARHKATRRRESCRESLSEYVKSRQVV
jgi:hypothetical protein